MFKVGDKLTVNNESCTVVSLLYGKVTVQYDDKFKCLQILEPSQLGVV